MKWFTALVFVFASTVVYADGVKLSGPTQPQWKSECSGCHIAYPPQLLTAGNWQQLMGGLDKHFGANATMAPNDSKAIQDFLQRNAGSGDKHSASSLRISDTTWFKREHREVSNKTWANPAVKNRSNCTACHVNAERGDWSEDGVRLPGR